MEGIEGFEVAIAALLEKMSICQFYSGIYRGVSMPSGSTENNLQLQEMQDSALPELYAAVIVFSVKAQSYFEVKGTYIALHVEVSFQYTELESGIKKVGNVLKSFDIEFQPFIDEIDAKEGVIRECADAATMERVKSKYNPSGSRNSVFSAVRHGQFGPQYLEPKPDLFSPGMDKHHRACPWQFQSFTRRLSILCPSRLRTLDLTHHSGD